MGRAKLKSLEKFNEVCAQRWRNEQNDLLLLRFSRKVVLKFDTPGVAGWGLLGLFIRFDLPPLLSSSKDHAFYKNPIHYLEQL